MAKRISALLMCILMIITMFPVGSVVADDSEEMYEQTETVEEITEEIVEESIVEEFAVTLDGTPVDGITLTQDARTTLTVTSGMRTVEERFRWMILVDEDSDFWVDIHGEEEPSLTVSYAMVKTVLNSQDQAWVRCVRQTEMGEELSDAVCITVLPLEELGQERDETDAQETIEEEMIEETEPETEPVTEPEMEPETEPVTEPEIEPETEPVTEPETEPETEPVTESEMEPETEPEFIEEVLVEEEDEAAELIEVVEWFAEEPDLAMAGPVFEDAPLEEEYYSDDEVMYEAADMSEDETIEKFILSIQYVYASGSMHSGEVVAPPWSAEISSIQEYSATIESPTIPGYMASPASVTFDYAVGELNQDVQYTVYYSPAAVGYTVKHFWQNVNDDNYVEHEVEPKSGVTESYIPDNLGKDENGNPRYDGFEALPYITTETIAANGGTTVEIYYDRLYYLMSFDLEGGYGVYPIYARYGTDITVGIPIKAGYAFDGWDVEIPDTMPAGSVTYTARWKPIDTNYKVVYWVTDEDGTRSLIGSRIERGASGTQVDGRDDLATSVICGHETTHVHDDSCYSCGEIEHAHSKDACFSGMNLIENQPGNGVYAIEDLEKGEPQSGYIYVVYSHEHVKYWPKLYLNGIYYRIGEIQGGTDEASYSSIVNGEKIASKTGWYNGEQLTTIKYRPRTSCGELQHIHDEANRICENHSHVEECRYNTKHVEYVPSSGLQGLNYKTDENITINGDGTSVVNVYYRYKTYTIRYVYARQENTYYNSRYQIATLTGNGALTGASWTNVGANASVLPKVEDPNGNSERQYFEEGGYKYYYIALTAKFGENISEEWPGANIGNVSYNNTTYYWGSWAAAPGTGYRVKYGDEHANIVGPFPTMSDDMTVENPIRLPDGTYLAQNMNAWWARSSDKVQSHAYHNYFEVPAGTDRDPAETYKQYKNKWYKLETTYTFTAAHNGTTRVDPVTFDGYVIANEDKDKQGNSEKYANNGKCSICGKNCNYCNEFFYDAITYTLTFWNHDDYLVKGGTGSDVVFGTPLKNRFDYYAEVDGVIYRGANQLVALPESYPDSLPPNAYEFEGWYLSDNFNPDEKVDEDMTMPAENVMVYAHWVPRKYTVTVYISVSDDQVLQIIGEVPHGSNLSNLVEDLSEYEDAPNFVGWFYVDEKGQEQAFDFDSMPVTGDLRVYAKWKPSKIETITVRYVDMNTREEIAKTETYSAYVGSLRTYEAKAGEQLYMDSYYPTLTSQSITVSENGNNEVVFEYVQRDKVPYKVLYLLEDGSPAFRQTADGLVFMGGATTVTGEPYVKEEPENSMAVVTEVPLKATGSYLPDPAQKRLILSADEDQNVIIFVYKYNPDQAYYSVNHYILKPGLTHSNDLKDYDLYTDSQILGDVGKTYDARPITIPGTTFSKEITESMKGTNTWDAEQQKLSALLTQGSTTSLNFFYVRQVYPYRVRYVEAGSNINLLPDKIKDADGNTLKAQYGSVITEEAVDIDGYKVDAELKSHSIRSGEAAANTITFYYTRMTGSLKISKDVVLDKKQQQDDPNLKLPDGADTQPFAFVVSSEKAFYKQSFAYTITHKDGTQTEGTAGVVGTQGKELEPIALCDGETVVIEGLALGSYTVTERSVAGYKPTMNDQEREFCDVTLDQDGGEVVLEVVNAYPFFTGDLQIGKELGEVSGAPSGEDELFTFNVTLTPMEGTLKEQRIIRYKTYDDHGNRQDMTYTVAADAYSDPHVITLKMKAAENVTLYGVPAGSFTVVESIDENHFITDYYTATYEKATGTHISSHGSSATASGVINAGHTTTVDFTNTYKTNGKLTIRKTVTEEVPYDHWNGDTFTFRLTGTTQLPDGEYKVKIDGVERLVNVVNGIISLEGENPVITVAADEGDSWSNSIVITNLPAGVYSVEEVAAGIGLDKYNVDSTEAQSVKLLGNTMTATAGITNQYKRTTGSMRISKVIERVDGGAEIDEDQEFTFTVRMPTDGTFNEMTITGTMNDGTTVPGINVKNGQFTVTLKHEESITLTGLPIGVYSVQETQVVGYESQYQITDDKDVLLSEVRVDTQKQTTVACTNNYPVYIGELSITRENALDDNQVFVYEVKNIDTDSVVTVTVVGNSTTTIRNLPYGSYEITEKGDWSWRYEAERKEVKIGVEGQDRAQSVTYEKNANTQKWLNGNSLLVRNRWGGSSQG